ncbi:MAG: D-tyrosyl-tRNA(Tyr) deacylase [Leptospiraceae bacterium]|nr:D-tyrosyl-tRNA(Tyr) deacylase [Leptospiraceae bacterium]
MKALIQRVLEARVRVDGQIIGEIGPGMLVLLGAESTDTVSISDALSARLLKFRIFEDDAQKMNLSLNDTSGEILVVSQFTLAADLSKGNRPSFTTAAQPDQARELYSGFVEALRRSHAGKIATGQFGANMKVELINDGPVTFLLEEPRK